MLREAYSHNFKARWLRLAHKTIYREGVVAVQPRVSSEEPSVQDALNKRQKAPHQDTTRDTKSPYVGSPIPLVSIINSSTNLAPPIQPQPHFV